MKWLFENGFSNSLGGGREEFHEEIAKAKEHQETEILTRISAIKTELDELNEAERKPTKGFKRVTIRGEIEHDVHDDREKRVAELEAELRELETQKRKFDATLESPLEEPAEQEEREGLGVAGEHVDDTRGIVSPEPLAESKESHPTIPTPLVEVAEAMPQSQESHDESPAEKKGIKIGSYVMVEVNGQLQFKEPQKVVWLSGDGLFARIEGLNTGLAVKDLTFAEMPQENLQDKNTTQLPPAETLVVPQGEAQKPEGTLLDTPQVLGELKEEAVSSSTVEKRLDPDSPEAKAIEEAFRAARTLEDFYAALEKTRGHMAWMPEEVKPKIEAFFKGDGSINAVPRDFGMRFYALNPSLHVENIDRADMSKEGPKKNAIFLSETPETRPDTEAAQKEKEEAQPSVEPTIDTHLEAVSAIKDASSFDALYAAIKNTHGITEGFAHFPDLGNKSGRFGVEGFKWLIERVRKGEERVESVPHDYGVQAKVRELLAIDTPVSKTEEKLETVPEGFRKEKIYDAKGNVTGEMDVKIQASESKQKTVEPPANLPTGESAGSTEKTQPDTTNKLFDGRGEVKFKDGWAEIHDARKESEKPSEEYLELTEKMELPKRGDTVALKKLEDGSGTSAVRRGINITGILMKEISVGDPLIVDTLVTTPIKTIQFENDSIVIKTESGSLYKLMRPQTKEAVAEISIEKAPVSEPLASVGDTVELTPLEDISSLEEKRAEPSSREGVESSDTIRQQKKILKILLTGDYTLLNERDVDLTPEDAETLGNKFVNKEITEKDFWNLIANIEAPKDFGQMGFEVQKDRGLQSAYQFLCRVALDSNAEVGGGMLNISLLSELIKKYPTPALLDAAMEEKTGLWKAQMASMGGVSSEMGTAENELSLYESLSNDLKKFRLLIYGKREEYWQQIKALKKFLFSEEK